MIHSDCRSSVDVIQLAYKGAFYVDVGAGGAVNLSSNLYWDSSNTKYIMTDQASQYKQLDGEHYFQVTSTTGNAGDTITFVDAMKIKNTGYAEFAGAADVRLTLGSQGTAGNNSANFVRGTGDSLQFNSAAGDYVWEVTGTEKMRLGSTGNLLPGANNSMDLGSTSKRWANIYTSDLHLKNEVGDWTVEEGENDLFITNNKTGKKFKFKLEEVT